MIPQECHRSVARRAVCRALPFAAVLCLSLPFSASAQAPNEAWRTIRTPHFYVHFPAALEPVARRGAGSAERAYTRLAPLLKPARGRIDLVITDHSDFTNGYAWVSPSPRIVVYARPPVDERSLRFREDWLDLVIQHELVHVFQLDRTKGWWRAAQMIFGRQPMLFPNAWAPSWLLEGLAVHYESLLGDGGRIEGRMLVPTINGKAVEDRLPRFGAWSVSMLAFPGGASVYAFGSMLVQDMQGRGGAGSVERFVDLSSGRLSPWAFERSARAAFGTTFAEQWRRFSDSVSQAVRRTSSITRLSELTAASWVTRQPRVAPDGRLLFVASNGRDEASLYELPSALNAPARRIARRNSLDANVALPDGRIVFAQSEWADPWRLHSDLWIRETDGREHALTRGARLAAPDARARDGAIVAVQVVPGTSRLVRVSPSGAVSPITSASLDTNWSAPRWSHDGTRLAATRWVRGGAMSIVILDTLGREPRTLATARAVVDDAVWTLDDAAVLFSVNATGAATIWSANVRTGALRQVAAGATSLDTPAPIPGGFVAIETRALGERLVRADLAFASGAEDTLPSITDTQPMEPAAPATGPVRRYRPLRQLVPRYWLPSIEVSDESKTRYGAWIGGIDVVGRHAYSASLQREPVRGEQTGSFFYRYSGFGMPLVDVSMRQTWDHSDLVDSTNAPVGVLSRRRRFAGAALTLIRQRTRTVAVLSGGAEMEWRDFVTDPALLIQQLGSPLFLRTLRYPTLTATAAWSNTRAPILAFGPEDGVTLGVSGRWRHRTSAASTTRSSTYVGTAAVFKSLGFLPGPWHHVIALRGAVGTTDDRTNTQLEAGGVSGSSAELAPGIVVGDVQRTFFVRGFSPGAQAGIRAMSGSAEWRLPLVLTNWGKGFIPFFAQRVAFTAFADAGAAWCPAGALAQTIGCPRGETPRTMMSSVGGELTLDAAVFNYDTPYRLRLGFAKPVQGKAYTGAPNGSVYFSLGLSF
jgi:Tol biopolymer transport system component